MNRRACRMNGGREDDIRQGESGSQPTMGMITLEDLDAFNEDEFSTDLGGSRDEEHEVTEDQGQDLLNYWQDIGRGHHIDVPQDMAQPIQQLTSSTGSTRDRETAPYTLVTRNEKSGRVVYEKRVYQKATWACITMREDTYEQSICVGFMKLMRYICKQNTLGIYLGMTLPIVTVVMTDDSRSRLSREVRVGYYLPSHHQDHPPMPFDPDITMETWPTTVVYSRPFSGPTTVTSILEEIHGLAEVLDSPELYVNNCFIIAGYTSLAAAHRHNEVWFLEHC
ncbi:heme-binding protein 1 isoform X2 [Esox lucius]|uniref:Heme-binding protein soul3 n=1 Tax=Esox lucius TaxID=8010 RepID=A0A3P8Y6Q0_ESOLU|nr:heme-binding protein 1 isoform X2 [Esox lucius]